MNRARNSFRARTQNSQYDSENFNEDAFSSEPLRNDESGIQNPRTSRNPHGKQPAQTIKNVLNRVTTTATTLNTKDQIPLGKSIMLAQSASERFLHSSSYFTNSTQMLNNSISNKQNMMDQQLLEGNSNNYQMVLDRCHLYEKEIMELSGAKEEMTHQLIQATRESQRLKDEIQRLRSMLETRTIENSRLKGLYESKAGEVQEVTNEITSRIEKEQTEKNIFIKEINNKNIEINKLRQSYSVVKSENDTLNLFIKEKESEIEHLRAELGEIYFQKDKLERYELELSESNNMLKDIETTMQNLEREGKLKDKIIDENNVKINTSLNRIKSYEEKIIELDEAMGLMEQDRSKLKVEVAEKQTELEEWKEHYLLVSRKVEGYSSMEIKLKNSLATIDDLEVRISELLSTNQKLKLQHNSQTVKERRLQEVEMALASTNKTLKQKEEEIIELRDRNDELDAQLRRLGQNQESVSQLEKSVEQKVKELKLAERRLEERSIIIANQERQLKRMQDQNDKLKDRSDKIDQIYKENKRLTTSLMEKINQIEELQHTINALESRVASLVNENMKLDALFQQAKQSANEINNSLEDAKMRIEYEVNLKIQLQENIDKNISEISMLRRTLEKEKEAARNDKQLFRKEIELRDQAMLEEKSRFESYRAETQSQINQERRRIEELNGEVREVKRRIEAQQKREKEQQEVIGELESGRRRMMEQFSSLRTTYEQSVARCAALDKWRVAFLRMKESMQKTVLAMGDTVEQLTII